MSTATILPRLRETVRCAFERSTFYQKLYGAMQNINTLEDFCNLPVATRLHLEQADGAIDFVCVEDGQLVMELNGVSGGSTLSFTPMENECDMERRYRRVTNMLNSIGASPEATAILADNRNMYFAAEIERVLPWSLLIVLSGDSDSISVPEIVSKVGATTVICATECAISSIPATCRCVVTFNRCGCTEIHLPPGCSQFDVLTTALIPWLAVSSSSGIYDTLDGTRAEDGGGERQFYLEHGERGTLIVTGLTSSDEPGAMPIVRYDTEVPIREVDEHRFAVHSRESHD